ncbi:MAG: UPF0280 family protein, partial [Spirochaetales bacterium]|nr:UPF0280 family protein [Spirochaetales bacterium]
MKTQRGFGPRWYRERMGKGRFTSWRVAVGESDLWIGIDSESASLLDESRVRQAVHGILIADRNCILCYGAEHPGFLTSFEPLPEDPLAGRIISGMLKAGKQAGIGPMGAVAGAVAQSVGQQLSEIFNLREIVVENGGDVFMELARDLHMNIYAGDSPLSGELGVCVPVAAAPLGVCTSAGTVGHSFSRGRADAVTVSCRDAALADAWA